MAGVIVDAGGELLQISAAWRRHRQIFSELPPPRDADPKII